MAKGPKTPAWVEREIAEIYTQAADKGEVLPAKMVHVELENRLKKRARPGEPVPALPSLRKVQLVLTEARKRDEPQDIDGPWSLGLSAKFNIPDDANGDLLKIWKRCLVVGYRFTIREAQWAARLRSLPLKGMLLFWAREYALRERASALVGEAAMYTVDLDWALAGSFADDGSALWLYNTAVGLGFLPELALRSSEDLEAINKMEHADLSDPMETVMSIPASSIIMRALHSYVERAKGLEQDPDMVYALWLRRFGETVKWGRLSKAERESVAGTLFDEVKAVNPVLSEEGFHWKPSPGLLERAGLVEIKVSGEDAVR